MGMLSTAGVADQPAHTTPSAVLSGIAGAHYRFFLILDDAQYNIRDDMKTPHHPRGWDGKQRVSETPTKMLTNKKDQLSDRMNK
jgi:hypothetical protein